ncbi:MAG: hypothetical protein RDV48_29720 [Candidatus Eremiobacteraeota bacterium]|nr:hypothetical protein [Candidatus Eremiobacteraeota bacterium]
MRKVIVLDTSVMCAFLEVPGKETCMNGDLRWDRDRVEEYLKSEEQEGTTLVLPIATIIETGNHIAQAPSQRYEKAKSLVELLEKAVDEETPWAAFTEQKNLWTEKSLRKLINEWPELASSRLSMGDATIKDVAEFYAQMGYRVEIFTGDQGLKGYETPIPPSIPRRRRNA